MRLQRDDVGVLEPVARRLAFRAPLPGAWLLRGIDLRASESEPDTWDSRFVALAFFR